jgi:hypothetical protein
MNVQHRLLAVGCVLGVILSIGWSLGAAAGAAPAASQPVDQSSVISEAQLPTMASARSPGQLRASGRRAAAAAQIVNTNTPTRTPTPITIGNFVRSDFDGDGVQDTGEAGLSGITVQLWNAAKNDLLGSTTTNSNGNYTLVAPVPGDYRIRVILPAGVSFTLKDLGADTTDSDINPSGVDFGFTDVFNLASNVISITTKDAGIRPPPTPTRTPTPINIGNFVGSDLNGDGVQNAGEYGLTGIVVQLWNAAKNDLLGQTTTNSNGNYTLVAPIPGDYRIRVLLPSGASFTLKDQGVDTADSDINASGVDLGFTDVFNLASNVISITTKDAGLINVPATPTPTNTRTPTTTPTPTNTPTQLPTPQLTDRVKLPLIRR